MHFFVDWLGKCEHTFWHITRVEHTRYLMFISHVFAFLTQSRKLLLFENSFANERLRQIITYSSLKPIKNNCLNRGSRGTQSLISSLIINKLIWNSDPLITRDPFILQIERHFLKPSKTLRWLFRLHEVEKFEIRYFANIFYSAFDKRAFVWQRT